MPLATVTTNVTDASKDATDAMLKDLSSALARCFSKPESYVMTCLHPPATMTFAGTTGPTAYVEVKNVGTMSEGKAKKVTAEVTTAISRHLGVSSDRVYVELSDAKAHLWGFDGDTFA